MAEIDAKYIRDLLRNRKNIMIQIHQQKKIVLQIEQDDKEIIEALSLQAQSYDKEIMGGGSGEKITGILSRLRKEKKASAFDVERYWNVIAAREREIEMLDLVVFSMQHLWGQSILHVYYEELSIKEAAWKMKRGERTIGTYLDDGVRHIVKEFQRLGVAALPEELSASIGMELHETASIGINRHGTA